MSDLAPAGPIPFHGSGDYWEERYRRGRTSGDGSYGRLARFKARVLNHLVKARGIKTVIEFGCGDGAQLSLADYPRYLGLDVSETVLDAIRLRFADDPAKEFASVGALAGRTADLTLSLDVIYHLIEDDVFEDHMRALFDSADRFVAIYAGDFERGPPETAAHVRHRMFSRWIVAARPDFVLHRHISNRFPGPGPTKTTSLCDFYVYRRLGPPANALAGGTIESAT